MSLQDDYFDLDASLKGEEKKAFNRIWEAFVDMEAQEEELLKIRGCLREAMNLVFKEENKYQEDRIRQLEVDAKILREIVVVRKDPMRWTI